MTFTCQRCLLDVKLLISISISSSKLQIRTADIQFVGTATKYLINEFLSHFLLHVSSTSFQLSLRKKKKEIEWNCETYANTSY